MKTSRIEEQRVVRDEQIMDFLMQQEETTEEKEDRTL